VQEKREKLIELKVKSSIEVTRLHHYIQAAFNRTIIAYRFSRENYRSQMLQNPRVNSIARQLMTQFVAEQPGILFIQKL